MTKRIFSILIVFLLIIFTQASAQDTQKQGSSFSPVWLEGKNSHGARKEPIIPQKPMETEDTKGEFKMTTLEIILLITTIICGFFWLEQRNRLKESKDRLTKLMGYFYFISLITEEVDDATAIYNTEKTFGVSFADLAEGEAAFKNIQQIAKEDQFKLNTERKVFSDSKL